MELMTQCSEGAEVGTAYGVGGPGMSGGVLPMHAQKWWGWGGNRQPGSLKLTLVWLLGSAACSCLEVGQLSFALSKGCCTEDVPSLLPHSAPLCMDTQAQVPQLQLSFLGMGSSTAPCQCFRPWASLARWAVAHWFAGRTGIRSQRKPKAFSCCCCCSWSNMGVGHSG